MAMISIMALSSCSSLDLCVSSSFEVPLSPSLVVSKYGS